VILKLTGSVESKAREHPKSPNRRDEQLAACAEAQVANASDREGPGARVAKRTADRKAALAPNRQPTAIRIGGDCNVSRIPPAVETATSTPAEPLRFGR
jgi:hypothetical protein